MLDVFPKDFLYNRGEWTGNNLIEFLIIFSDERTTDLTTAKAMQPASTTDLFLALFMLFIQDPSLSTA
ncbi:hypothetical protein QQ055_06515 [Geitlerinema calcuttense NRMC-F 0142]|uniref:Uncharacterized protein n=1 Tax=Geitlerinema calcuttense NRMC-F 0142 TaxID=2922238 RepID=A0ABT7LYP7_9CYAN|nr:hypothetical protein [Geitlerinema calcuttense NRMC-F 0142]